MKFFNFKRKKKPYLDLNKMEKDKITETIDISENTILDSIPVSKPLPVPKKYQWIRGERVGNIEEYKEKKIVGKTEWVYFTSGKRISSELLSEYMIEINDRQHPLELKDLKQIENPVKKVNIITESYKSPVRQLLEKQKKFETIDISYNFSINIPSNSLYELMSENFGDEVKNELTNMILETLSIEKIQSEIKETIINNLNTHYNLESNGTE